MKSICVFCGSKSGTHPDYAQAAEATANLLLHRGIRLVYGGGDVGLMGITARTVMDGGGQVTGIIPQFLWDREVGKLDVTELHIVDTMHTRKRMMWEASDAFWVLPGGFGTLEEVAEMLTWSQLGLHAKPIGLLNVRGFYNTLLSQLDHMVAEGFLSPANRAMVLVADTPEALFAAFQAWNPSGGGPMSITNS